MKKVYPAKQFARVTLVVMMMIFSLSGLQAQTNRVDETRMVTLNMQKASVREILDEIQKQTGYKIFYSDNSVDVSRKVNVSARQVSVRMMKH